MSLILRIMNKISYPKIDKEQLKELLLDVAQQRSVPDVLDLIVSRLAERANVALARIWLKQPGDICSVCPMQTECPDRTECLHLVASSGSSVQENGKSWDRLDGQFRRFPIGIRKIGQIAAHGEPVEITDIKEGNEWIVNQEWIFQENIHGLGGQPLTYKGEIIGVLAVFTRVPLNNEILSWLRMLANHIAGAITNARAFEEINCLKKQLELENVYLREEVSEVQAFGSILGQGPSLMNVIRQIDLVANTDASVLISGESGTGKELVAREIHRLSGRKDQPLIKVNCASIPRELFESEFFGHVRGSFTGAVRDRAGRFEVADKGTLFLDEVGEIPLELQSKLLRVLQEGQYERVGEESTRQADVRIIAATNKNLGNEVEAGRFRRDLYYRLNVVPINVPPLRNRREDIPLLARHFLEKSCNRISRPILSLTQANVLDLQKYDWPGNVRELQNVIERAVITARFDRLHFDLTPNDENNECYDNATRNTDKRKISEVLSEADMKGIERENTLEALRQCKWKIYGSGGAAELIGIKPTTLVSRIKKLGIKKPN